MRNSHLRPVIPVLLAILLLTTGCRLLAISPTPEPLQPASPAIPEQSAPADPVQADVQTEDIDVLPSGFMRYTDDVSGISFAYPEGWTMIAPDDALRRQTGSYAFTLASYDINNMTGSAGIPPDETKVDINIGMYNVMFGDGMSIESILDWTRNLDTVQEILEETRFSLPDGSPAVKVRTIGFMDTEVTTFNLIVADNGIAVSGFGDQTIIEQIARSLRGT